MLPEEASSAVTVRRGQPLLPRRRGRFRQLPLRQEYHRIYIGGKTRIPKRAGRDAADDHALVAEAGQDTLYHCKRRQERCELE